MRLKCRLGYEYASTRCAGSPRQRACLTYSITLMEQSRNKKDQPLKQARAARIAAHLLAQPAAATPLSSLGLPKVI